MTALQWFFLGFNAVVIATSPFTVARAIRRGERRRIVEIFILASIVVWCDIDILRPALILSGPLFVHWYSVVVGSGLVTAETLRSLWVLFSERKASAIERR